MTTLKLDVFLSLIDTLCQVIDEAAQATEIACYVALLKGRKAILAGELCPPLMCC